MMSKKMGVVFICLIVILGAIDYLFKHSDVAHIIARAIPVVFGIYFLTQRDFKTKYPMAVNMRPGLIIAIIILTILTVYQYIIK